jgi:hypothetical protein
MKPTSPSPCFLVFAPSSRVCTPARGVCVGDACGCEVGCPPLFPHGPSPFPSWPNSAPPPPALPPRPSPCMASVVVHAGVVCGACECARAGLESSDELVNSPPPPPFRHVKPCSAQCYPLRCVRLTFPCHPVCVGPSLQCTLAFVRLQWGSSGAVVVRGERPIRNRHPNWTAI